MAARPLPPPLSGRGGCIPKGNTSSPNTSSPNTSSPSLLSRIISGSTGSIIYALVGTPIEVVKVRQQAAPSQGDSFSSILKRRGNPAKMLLRSRGTVILNNGLMLPMNAFPCLAAPGMTHSVPSTDFSICSRLLESCRNASKIVHEQSSGTFRMLHSIFRNEGFAGIYAGLRPTLVMSIPNTVIHLSSYDEITMRLRAMHSSNSDDAYIPLVAGSSARIISSFATAPLELIRTRQASLIASSNVPSGMFHDFGYLLRQGGMISFYKGLGPLLLRDAPFAAIYFLCFEKFRSNLSDTSTLGRWSGGYYKEQEMQLPASLDLLHTFTSGASAALVATILTGPFDVAKTRIQTLNKAAGANAGTLSCMQQIFREEGVKGLWKGNVSRMIKVVPGHSIMITCYIFGKKIFDDIL